MGKAPDERLAEEEIFHETIVLAATFFTGRDGDP
jgi:hypothetical protein